MGPLSWEEGQLLFQRADILINTTAPDREGFPNTYLQAWNVGIPVVTLDCDPDNILTKNRMGFCSKTLDQMVVDVDRLLQDSELRRDMGNRAYEYLAQNHDCVKIGVQLNDLFCDLLKTVTRD